MLTAARNDKMPSPMTSRDDELVLGLPRDVVPGGLDWRGVRQLAHAPVVAAVEQHGTYRRRGDAENDPSWKQVIPYVALRDGGDIFLMRRTRAGRDVRLHDRYTIGVGGHVNPEDGGILVVSSASGQRKWRPTSSPNSSRSAC